LQNQKLLYYAAAATTGLAGILHLFMAPMAYGFNISTGVFFAIAGIAQLFWAIPMIKRWSGAWNYTGIAGTAGLIALWVITRMPNPITGGQALPVNEIGVAVEGIQSAFITLVATIVVRERKMKELSRRTAAEAA